MNLLILVSVLGLRNVVIWWHKVMLSCRDEITFPTTMQNSDWNIQTLWYQQPSGQAKQEVEDWFLSSGTRHTEMPDMLTSEQTLP